jgi:hypothetical protein
MPNTSHLFAISLMALTLFFACGTSVDPAVIMIGRWQGDPDNARNDPDIKKESENNPMGDFFLKAMEEFYKALEVELTSDTFAIKMQIPGEEPKRETAAYKVVSKGKDTVVIESSAKGTVGEKLVIKIVDRDHIRIASDKPSDEQPAFILKRSK